jgi:hypothetical protein
LEYAPAWEIFSAATLSQSKRGSGHYKRLLDLSSEMFLFFSSSIFLFLFGWHIVLLCTRSFFKNPNITHNMDFSTDVCQRGKALPDFQSLKLPEPEVLASPDSTWLASPYSSGDEMDDFNIPLCRTPRDGLVESPAQYPPSPRRRGSRASCRQHKAPTPKAQKEREHRNCLLEQLVFMQNLILDHFGRSVWGHWKPLNENNRHHGLKYNKADVLRTSNQLFMQMFAKPSPKWPLRAKL